MLCDRARALAERDFMGVLREVASEGRAEDVRRRKMRSVMSPKPTAQNRTEDAVASRGPARPPS